MSEEPNHIFNLQETYDRLAEGEEQTARSMPELTAAMRGGFYDEDIKAIDAGRNFAAVLHRLLKARAAVDEELKQLRRAFMCAQARTGSK